MAKQGEEKSKRNAAILVIAVCSAFLYWFLRVSPPGVDSRLHQALGQVVAEETVKLLGTGGHVVVVARDTVTYKNPASDIEMEAFRTALKKAGANVATTKIIKMNPIGLMRVPPGDFLEILKKQADTDVIVSFLGPPILAADQLARLGDQRPKIVAVCTGAMPDQVNLKAVFEAKLLHAAIISRKNPPSGTPKSENLRGVFDQLYTVVTPANLAELSPPTAVRP